MLSPSRALALLLTSLVLAIVACGGGEASGEPPSLSGPIREMLEEVAAARGLEAPTNLRMEVVAPEDMVEVYTGRVADEDRETLQQGGALYQLLGYIEPGENLWDVTLSTAELITGFYSFRDKTLWVVTDKDSVDPDSLSKDERSTLAHEMAHAIQDYHFDLVRSGSRIAATVDAGLAWTSVVEGDAVLSTVLWEEGISLRPAGGLGGPVLLLANLNQEQIDPQILRVISFPYLSGAIAMRDLAFREGPEALNALYAIPPPSTAHILHPHLLGTDWLPESVGHLLPAAAIGGSLGPGWTEAESGVLGEFHLVNYLLGDTIGYPWPAYGYPGPSYNEVLARIARAGEGWQGDSYRLFENGEERVLVVVVRFDTSVDARQFDAAHRSALARGASVVEGPYMLVTRDDEFVVGRFDPGGRTVFFVIGTSAEVVRAALEPLVRG